MDVPQSLSVVSESGFRSASAIGPTGGQRRDELADRLANILLASSALIVTSPIILVFAILVRLTSPGPVFYTQARIGLNRRRRNNTRRTDGRRTRDLGGRPFLIYKFRSMRVDAERPTGAVWATPGDARVTLLGRFMRKYRIDELPQLVNVIRGDMNIVGPRPERPSIFSHLSDAIEQYPERQRARPGITGLAQVNLSYDTSVDDVRAKVRLDLEYLERQSFSQDVKIMARTLPVLLFRKGGW